MTRFPILRTSARFVLLALAVFGCQGCSGDPEPSTAHQFRLESLDGDILGPSDFEGKVVVVDFWATWCQPCHAQTAVLRGLHEEMNDRGVQFLAVDLGEPEPTVKLFMERNPVPYPVLLDPERSLAAELGIQSLPTLLVIDRQGRTTYFAPGVIPEDRLRDLISEAAG